MRIPWDKYETALLIDMYWKIENGEITWKDGVSSLSTTLRARAINNKIEIDDLFRNENGIALQLKTIEYIFYNGEKGLKKTPSKIYVEIADLYNNDKNKFAQLLFEANVTTKTYSNQELFKEWLLLRYSEAQMKNAIEIYNKIESFCKPRILTKSFFDINDLTELNNLEASLLKNKLLNAIFRKGLYQSMLDSVKQYKEYLKCIAEIRNNYQDALNEVKNNIQSEPEKYIEESKEEILYVDFFGDNDYRFTSPKEVVAFGNKEAFTNWKAAYVFIIRELLNRNPEKILSLKRKNISNGDRIDFGTKLNLDSMISPKEIKPSLFVETNLSATDIIKKIKILLEICEENYYDVEISYIKKDKTETEKENKNDNSSDIELFKKWLTETNYNSSIVEKYSSVIMSLFEKASQDNIRIDKTNTKEVMSVFTNLISSANDNAKEMIMHSAVRKYIQFLNMQNGSKSSSGKNNTKVKQNVTDPYDSVDMSDISTVLEKNFSNGYRYTSKIGRRRFENLYENQIGHPLKLSEDELITRIEYLCVIVDDIAYLTSSMIDEELKANILSYIQNSFNSGKSTVYLEAIIREFSDEFFKTCIGNNETLLKKYLEKINTGSYFVNYNFVSSKKDIKINPEEEIKDVLISVGMPLTYDELFAKLPHLPQSKIRYILSVTDRFIKNQTSQYFDVDIVNISQKDLDEISTYIANAIYNRGYLGGKELVSTVKSNYKAIVEQNEFLTELGLRDAIGYLLKDYYSFKGKIISSKDEKLDMKKIFADFCKNTGTFTLDDLYRIKDELGTPIYFDSVYENSLRISKNQFVPKNSINFPVNEIDKVLEQFCPGDYVSIRDVNTFGLFPYIDYPWNEFLLEHYVDSYSEEFKLLNLNHNAKKIVGAIVKKNSPYYDIEQILADVLAKSGFELSENIALDYLIERGFIASRSYSNMAGVITNARKIRNQR